MYLFDLKSTFLRYPIVYRFRAKIVTVRDSYLYIYYQILPPLDWREALDYISSYITITRREQLKCYAARKLVYTPMQLTSAVYAIVYNT